ncbi:SDR family NAD(P)-dependent oxidoreductase [Streptomyces californicus]|uniref:SDR family NAD(P)-dependent oxidoreductase n=1 Tax=Streptomyces californicus TaxID=67351 RepID=UPI0035DB43FC
MTVHHPPPPTGDTPPVDTASRATPTGVPATGRPAAGAPADQAPLAGRTALVTGATGQLGDAVCRLLAARGAAVVGVHRTPSERAEALAAGTGARLLRADLSDPDETAALLGRVRELGPAPDILVCAHGATARRPVLGGAYDAAAEQRLWQLNTGSVQQLASAAAKRMMRAKFGRIVLFGSRGGATGMPGQPGYAATKAALSGWAASAAWELGPFGVTVNVIAPGAVRARPEDAPVYSAEEDERAAGRTAVRRLAEPAEIAEAVGFLAAPGASYVTGQTLLVDGGARW